MITVKNLTKRFGDVVAVNNVSFEVRRGEVLGFLGPNAAGKTTTMRVLTCYLPPDEGTANIAGYDILEDSIEVRKKVGYLPESTPLYTDMNVLDYLNFVAEVRGINKADRQRKIKQMVEICALEKMVSRDIGELSRGYRQRVGLAQVLIHDPDILILDEPTSGLDPTQIIEIRELIKRIGREKTVILSTHILSEVEATCSRVIIIDEGRLIASGTPDELATKAKGGESIYVSIRGPQSEVEPKLRELPNVKQVERQSVDEKGYTKYIIKSDVGAELNEKVFNVVVENNWTLSELKKEEVNLEQIFLHLTAEEGQ